MSTETKQNIGFKLVKIETKQFAILQGNYNGFNDNISLGISLGFGADVTDQIVASTAIIEFMQSEKVFMIIEVACQYNIQANGWQQLEINEESLKLPVFLATHLAALTIGTTRGVLHAKTDNSEFNKFLLPTVDVTKHLTEDVKIALQKATT